MKMKSYKLPLFFWNQGKRSIQENLEKDIKKLLSFYRKKGFYEAVINHHIEPNLQENLIRIIINIQEGPKYRLSISGNKEFWTYTLKKELTLSKKGNANDFGLKKSVKNIYRRYRNAGYPDCKVSYTTKMIDKGGRQYKDVHIKIEENSRYIVRSSHISGSEAISGDILKQEVLTGEKGLLFDGQFVESTFEENGKAIESFYSGRGYIDTTVKSSIQWTREDEDRIKYGDAVFKVTEGYQKIIQAVSFLGLSTKLEQEITTILQTKAGIPLIIPQIQKDRQAILSFLAEKGYIYAEVEARVIPGKDKEACSIEFVIVKRTRVNAAGVWTFGNFRTKDIVLLRHNDIAADQSVSLSNFVGLQKSIRNINCIARADFKALGIKEKSDQLYFIADVEEKKPYYFETSIGYDTAKDAYLDVSLGDRNFLGMNRELYLDAGISGIGYDAVLGIKDFDFLSQYILSEFSVYASQEELKNQTFGSRKYGSQVSFEKDLSRFLKVGTNLGLEFREQYQLDETAAMGSDVYDTRGIVAFTPFITWNSVDSFVKPTKGFYFNGSAGYNRDVLEDLDNFIKYRAKAKYYYQVFPRLVMAFQGMIGYIQNFARDSKLPDDQLFFLGGISDVRGFDENELIIDSLQNPAGGKTQIAGSVEARIDLGMNFEIPLFLDVGSLKDTGIAGSNDDFRFTIGSGIRYMTPVGPVGLLYGHKLNPENGEKGRLHFSIGYTF